MFSKLFAKLNGTIDFIWQLKHIDISQWDIEQDIAINKRQQG
jgi:hypothetical protein